MRRAAVIIAVLAGGCSLQPAYVRPAPPVPSTWPQGGPYLARTAPVSPGLAYDQVMIDPRLRTLIRQALADNRDLREALANVEAARALYRIQRAQRLPGVDLAASAEATGGDGAGDASPRFYALDVLTPGFELDLFGRVRSLGDAARQRYFASDAGARAVRVTLVADLAEAWATYAADRTLLEIAEQTAASAEASVRLTRARLDAGVAPASDLRQAETVLATAQADIAALQAALAQDYNALALLTGRQPDAALLPTGLADLPPAFRDAPAGLSSDILLLRPDVQQAEHALRAAHADIGAARAALFPRISLTAGVGVASDALSRLLSGDPFVWSAGADAAAPLFDGGAGRAGVAYAEAGQAAAAAAYERAIQSAFRETADALARQGSMGRELEARGRGRAAAEGAYLLADARYRGGIADYLSSLDAQRSLYAARRAEAAAQLAGAVTRIALYRALAAEPAPAPATDSGPPAPL